jgi:hypothetical protein
LKVKLLEEALVAGAHCKLVFLANQASDGT